MPSPPAAPGTIDTPASFGSTGRSPDRLPIVTVKRFSASYSYQ
ncbi:hypothetical protein BamMEX5DRAFT_1540 [Burkholderia ambifaria MEX-5]|uniref:Uncharacterized protein n=1 Tax=Burkholderia ambifaria MEX-5 TaxID=396597 RepID=B1T174_9BURK|nr:hypothetical protein BamMEX5DRAFT_1540 [Burkholderia ambifaria MEX-5]